MKVIVITALFAVCQATRYVKFQPVEATPPFLHQQDFPRGTPDFVGAEERVNQRSRPEDRVVKDASHPLIDSRRNVRPSTYSTNLPGAEVTAGKVVDTRFVPLAFKTPSYPVLHSSQWNYGHFPYSVPSSVPNFQLF